MQDAVQNPVDKRRGLGRTESLGQLDRFIDRHLARRLVEQDFVGAQSKNRAIDGGDSAQMPVGGRVCNALVDLGTMCFHTANQPKGESSQFGITVQAGTDQSFDGWPGRVGIQVPLVEDLDDDLTDSAASRHGIPDDKDRLEMTNEFYGTMDKGQRAMGVNR